MRHIISAALLALAAGAAMAATAIKPAEIVITKDPGVTVTVTRRTGNTSKTIAVTVNKQDTVITKDIAPPAPPASSPSTDPIVVPPPPVVDHSLMGPVIDASKIPPAAAGTAEVRVRTTWVDPITWFDPATGLDAPSCTDWSAHCSLWRPNPSCTSTGPTCFRQPAETPAGPQPDIGAFREPCDFAVMKRDDPIVFPGQPGASHMHTFFGNVAVDAFTTPASILSGNSTCAGGALNRSAYWVPSMIDTGNGTPLKPGVILTYYKGSYAHDISQTVVPLPPGLRLVAGNAKNTDPTTVGARYICMGPAGENPGWSSTITAAFALGTCKVGGDFIMEVGFPHCWDGVNLDSPNHASHFSAAVQLQAPPFTWSCPATHPVTIPVISYNIHYTITDDKAVSRWRLSSDMDPALPAGISGHGDYFMGWDAKTMQTFVTRCIHDKFDCHGFLLGDGTTLY